MYRKKDRHKSTFAPLQLLNTNGLKRKKIKDKEINAILSHQIHILTGAPR